jgi:hypothetical protein
MRYFFHLVDGFYAPDHEGTELPDHDAARAAASGYAAEVLRKNAQAIWQGHEVRVEVLDAAKRLLFTVLILGIDAPAARSG